MVVLFYLLPFSDIKIRTGVVFMDCMKENRMQYSERANAIVEQLTLEEKVYLMSGNITLIDILKVQMVEGKHYNQNPYAAGGNEAHGVPALWFCDGPRGVVCEVGKTTCFPVSMNRGASFDVELEKEIGRAIGREVRGVGGNFYGGVCINLPYNPGWGRSQEVYGEDSFALGELGSALVQGVQDENVIACIKHYAFNSMENSRFKVSVDCSRRTEREVFLPHFKVCIDAGAAGVMSAYNKYRGVYCGHSDYLLRKVLKEEWDFDGIVMSDFILGIRDTAEAANGGMDVEMNDTKIYGPALVKAVQDGLVDESRIDEAATRIVRTLLAFEDAYEKSGKRYGPQDVGTKEHARLALRAAQEGIVLMQNKNNTLPFSKELKSIAIIGELGNKANIGDHGSSQVYPAYVVTVLEGISKTMPDAEVVYYDGDNLEHARRLARESDAVVLVAGYNHNDEGEFVGRDDISQAAANLKGELAEKLHEMTKNFDAASLIGVQSSKEGGDRKESLGLHPKEVELIKAVGLENANSAVVLIGGNTILITEWMDKVSSILMGFYPGQEGGTAIAQILFGEVNPSAKLPFVLPYKESDLPQVKWMHEGQFYDYYHGYAKLDKEGVEPLLPYGFGLSYTEFSVKNVVFDTDGEAISGTCTVTNTGKRDGAEVIQFYVGFKNSKLDRPVKTLRGFARVPLAAGESKNVTVVCPIEKLKYFDEHTNDFILEHMEHELYLGTSASEKELLKGSITL
jgi:beta-glucosidase